MSNIPADGFVFPFLNQDEYQTKIITKSASLSAPADLPFTLQYAQSVHHNGYITEKSENLMRLDGRQFAFLHPLDAAELGLPDDLIARIGNENTSINIPIKISKRVNRGEILVVNSFCNNPVNRIMKKDRPVTYVSVRKV